MDFLVKKMFTNEQTENTAYGVKTYWLLCQ